jgi:hypothetical protein
MFRMLCEVPVCSATWTPQFQGMAEQRIWLKIAAAGTIRAC